jgi:ubiquinone/menaquinone biosynthesis C-methylase UbiE
VFYDHAPGLHDVVTEIAIRLLQATTSAEGRERYMRRLELGGLQPRADGQPIRILEIGVGTGTSLPLIRRALPSGLEVEIWGVDLSAGMMGECRKRLVRQPIESVRLLLADAHSLPFPDKMFDRVLEVGGTGGYRDPARALREMVRVARPGARIVIADEQLDQSRPQPLFHRLLFRLQTFYTSDAHCPVELLPGEVTDVLAEQITRYFYCLSFRLPPEPSASATN